MELNIWNKVCLKINWQCQVIINKFTQCPHGKKCNNTNCSYHHTYEQISIMRKNKIKKSKQIIKTIKLKLVDIQTNSQLKNMSNQDVCTICLTPFHQLTETTSLTCYHIFHTECVNDWFKQRQIQQCPMCRKIDSCQNNKWDNRSILHGLRRLDEDLLSEPDYFDEIFTQYLTNYFNNFNNSNTIY